VTTGAQVRSLGHTIHRLGEVVSTQIEAARLAAAGASEGTVVTATHQSAGRGRRGRLWLDAPGQSLLMSIVLRPAIAPGLAPQLSLVAAVAVADALANALGSSGVTAAIRWPNDVMVGKRKICGLLPEEEMQQIDAGAAPNIPLYLWLQDRWDEYQESPERYPTILEFFLDGLDRAE